jgi:acyl carrier protein
VSPEGSPESVDERIRGVLDQHGKLATDVSSLTEDADLYRAGLTSHASVNVMLALEDEFETEFLERMLRRQTFESIMAIREALEQLLPELRTG